jgi:hypothetical protein
MLGAMICACGLALEFNASSHSVPPVVWPSQLIQESLKIS